MPEAMIFDFDRTLADSSEGIFHTALYTVRKLGVAREYTEEDLRRFVGPPLRQCFVVAFGLEEALLDDALDIYRKEYDEHGRFMMHLRKNTFRRTHQTARRKFALSIGAKPFHGNHAAMKHYCFLFRSMSSSKHR